MPNIIGKIPLEKIGNIANFLNGIAFKPEDWHSNGLKIIRIQNLTDSSKPYNSTNRIVDPKYLVTKGDVLVSWSATIDVFVWKDEDALLNQHIFKVVFDDSRIHRSYFIHALKETITELSKHAHGTTMKHVVKSDFDNHKIPLPPLSEQIQIAEILTQAETLIAQRKESIRLLDELVKSQFLEMFGDPVKNEKGWEVKKLAQFGFSRLGKMLDGKRNTGNFHKPYLRNTNVQWMRFELDDLFVMDFDPKEQEEFSLKYGDVLMCEGGEIGRCAVWRGELQECYFQKALHRIRLNNKKLSPFYFVYYFYLFSKFGGLEKFMGAATIPHLTGEKLKEMKIPVPPISMQNHFAEFVENIEKQRILHMQTQKALESLYSSLSQKAFRGELTFAKETIALSDSNDSKESVSHPKKQSKDKSKTSNVIELKPTNVDFYKRTVLAAEIVWQLHKEPTFGHLKLQKLLYLCIRTSNMQLPVNFSQQAMGPYDPRLMRSIDKQLQEKKWFRYNKDNPLKYEALANAGQHEVDFQKYYSSEQARIFSLIKKFKTTKSDTVEIVATLYACLENIVEQEEAFSEALLMRMFYDWSDRKKVFDELEVRRVLQKMKDSMILPKGILSSIF